MEESWTARGEQARQGQRWPRPVPVRGLTFSHQQDPHVFLHVDCSQGPCSARAHGADSSRRKRPPQGAALPALPAPPASLSRRPARDAVTQARCAASAAAPFRSRDSASSASFGSAGAGGGWADGAPRGTSSFRTRTFFRLEAAPPLRFVAARS